MQCFHKGIKYYSSVCWAEASPQEPTHQETNPSAPLGPTRWSHTQFVSRGWVCCVGSSLNSHPSWLVTRLSAAPALPSGGAVTPDLEALYLNHITWTLCSFEVARVRHLSGPVCVYFPLSRRVLISWSDFQLCARVWLLCAFFFSFFLFFPLSVCVTALSWQRLIGFVRVARVWLTGWWEDNMERTTTTGGRSREFARRDDNESERKSLCLFISYWGRDHAAFQTLSATDGTRWRILQHLSPPPQPPPPPPPHFTGL